MTAAVLVIIPTYQEAATIQETLLRVRASTPEADLLVVDDASPDGTADLAEAVGVAVGGVFVRRRPAKDGLGRAYAEGFRWGLARGYGVVVEMDADGSHDARALPRLLDRCREGADVVIGSRYVFGGSIPNWSWHRRALSRFGNSYASALLGLGVRDATSGFRAYRASLLRRLDLQLVQSGGYCFQVEMTYRAARAGATIAEVPIAFVDRVEGESKMSPGIVAEALWHVTRWGAARLFSSSDQSRQADLPDLAADPSGRHRELAAH
jgi:glycosyltransferase involved in cell wall biosynthesis